MVGFGDINVSSKLKIPLTAVREGADALGEKAVSILLSYGISVSSNRQKVNAIFGSLAWSFSDDEIHQMLSGGLLLDGDSAEILCRRGFRQYIGLDFKGWVKREEGKYSLEMVNSKETGVREGFYFSTNKTDRLSILRPREGAREWTTVITSEKKRFAAGMVVYENELGGWAVTCAVPNPSLLPSNYQRQTITQKLIEFLSGGRFGSPMVTGGANLMPIHFVGRDKCFVVIFNGSPDRTRPVVRMDGVVVKHIQATLLPQEG